MTPWMQTGIGARLQKYTLDIDRRWSSAAKDTSDAVRRWSSDARGHRRTGKTSNPWYGVKCNKALIKAKNLKGLLGYPMYELFGYTSAILKIGDGKDLLNQFSRPTTEDEEQFGRTEERPQLEDWFRGLLMVSWTRGYSPHRLPTRWVEPRTPMAVQ